VIACPEVHEALGPYVLGGLEPAEQADVATHLAACPACAAEHRDLAGLPDLLARVTEPERDAAAPPARLEEEILDRHALGQAREDRPPARAAARPRRRRRRVISWAGAAAALAAAILVLAGTFRPAEDEALGYEAGLAGTAAAPAATGQASLEPAAAGTAVRLRARRLPAGASFELRCVRADGSWVSAGTFRAGADGAVDTRLTTAARLGTYEVLRVTSVGAGARRTVMRGIVPS
jgi:Anti-sigma-K factor rskA/Putative zinc-finger